MVIVFQHNNYFNFYLVFDKYLSGYYKVFIVFVVTWSWYDTEEFEQKVKYLNKIRHTCMIGDFTFM